MNTKNYPFAQELITDIDGNIRKVILDFNDYQHLSTCAKLIVYNQKLQQWA